MLNLLYYDMKATVRRSWYYILIIATVAFLVRFFMSENFQSFFVDMDFIYGTIITFVAIGFLGAFAILTVLVVIVYQTQWFDENLLSPEGQLTNMYPVTSAQIILSKILTSFIWGIILVAMAVAVLCIIMINTDYFEKLVAFVVEVAEDNNLVAKPIPLIGSLCAYGITGIASFVSMCFLSLMIGQMFSNYKNIVVLIAFVALLAVSGFVIFAIAPVVGVAMPESIASDELLSFCISAAAKLTIVNLIFTVIYGAFCSLILNKKYNS